MLACRGLKLLAVWCLFAAAGAGAAAFAWVAPQTLPRQHVAQERATRTLRRAGRGRGARLLLRPSVARASMTTGSWWPGPSDEDAREMSELMSIDPVEMERRLPAPATRAGRVRQPDS